jgi:hypothetical protein
MLALESQRLLLALSRLYRTFFSQVRFAPADNPSPCPTRGERADRVRSTALDSIFKQQLSTHSVIAGLDPGHDECRHLDSRHTFTPSRREAPEALMNRPPKEGVGNAGCPLHPRPRVHFVLVERTRVTTSTPESPGIPARNGFNGLLRALPGDRALLPPSPADMFCLSPVGPTQLRKT